MKRFCLLTLSLITLLLLAGCVENKYLEKLGLITAVGYDENDEEKLIGTLVLYQFNPAMEDVEKILTGEANTSKGIRLTENLDTDHKLASGQLRIAIYGRELAESGISQLVDTLERDSAIGNMVYLAVSDTTAEELLKYPLAEKYSNRGTYLYNLVRQNVESELMIAPTLQEFITDYGSVGKDPILPMLTSSEGSLGVGGFALFHRDRFVKEIDEEDMFYIRGLIENYHSSGSLEAGLKMEAFKDHLSEKDQSGIEKADMGEKLYFVFDSIHSRHKIKAAKQKKPHFTIELDMEVRLQEVTEKLKLSDPEVHALVEREAAQYIEKKIESTIKMLQENNVDPIGFGMEYRTVRSHESLTQEEWDNLYKDAAFDVSVHMNLKRTGVTD
ncbi:Ger(x)C family spore germination protein [Rossellomorea aquimaris]|uniref:Spore germination protein n=1 Tax=Rossellomorea aquimaris TaxID=189382 RepID=A0A1J6WHV1_9BACI|nr:Ger(x)C family spore germination C-terminal domain-containing protein [Rossellomorea aquimaris]OIU71432.1 hypothetical protein BHE18_10440 [Rossellomorea aquimaris]